MASKPSSKSTSSKSKSSSKKVAAPVTAKKAKKLDAAEVVPVPAPVFVEPAKVEAAPVVEAKVEVVEAAPTRTMTRGEFMDLVRQEAYRRAARRQFKNGSPFQDWVHAEAHVSGLLAAQGVRLS